jgi:hypothetical protein
MRSGREGIPMIDLAVAHGACLLEQARSGWSRGAHCVGARDCSDAQGA